MIDARGRSCPEPVIMTKDALERHSDGTIEVLVDAMVAVENIRRFAGNHGFHVEVKDVDEGYSLLINR